MAFTPAQLRPVFERLNRAGFQNVIVGGQAVNLWAMFYEVADDPQWLREQPYTSEDLDFLGKPSDTRRCAGALPGAQAKVNDDPGTAGPNTGLVLAPFGGGRLRVDLLSSVLGIGTTDALRDAATYDGAGELAGLSLRVLHPLHCLESKLAGLSQLSQAGRQDAKHVRLCVLAVREWLKSVLARGGARPALKIIERLGDLAVGADGLAAHRRGGVAVEDAIPLEEIRRRAGQPGHETLARFLELRQPPLWAHLARERREDAAFHADLTRRRAEIAARAG